MIENWITIGMSAYKTPGFQDTSRLMTNAFTGRTLYVEPPKPFQAWKQPTRDALGWKQETVNQVTVFSPPLPVPRKLDPLRIFFRRQAKGLERKVEGLLGPDWRTSTVVYITNWTPYLQPLVEALNAKYLVFDLVDDVLAFPYALNRDVTIGQWKWLADHAASILAVSPVMCEQSKSMFNREAINLPNGVDEIFLTGPNVSVKLPDELNKAKTGMRIGFAGTLNHWIDYQAISHIAAQFPDASIFLAGKIGNFGSDKVREAYEQMRTSPNIHYIGPLPYTDLPTFLHEMDVLFLPRIHQASSEASSPLKIYEYLAIGKPIVTSGIPIPPDMNGLIYAAEQYKDDLHDAMSAAFKEHAATGNEGISNQRQTYAKAHTWKQRIQTVLKTL